MIVRFNKFERAAGFFIVAAIVGAVVMTASIAAKKGWFASKIKYFTTFESAEGLHPGTAVQVAGVRAGEVQKVELISAEEVKVHFEILEQFKNMVRVDTQVKVIRPFIIGDKVLDLTIGKSQSELLPHGAEVLSVEAFDMMDLVSGKKLAPFLGSLEGLMRNMSLLAEAFADPKRTKAFIRMFDKMNPLIDNMNIMSKEISRLTHEMNIYMPQIKKHNPELGKDLALLMGHMNSITGNLSPAFSEVGSELPQASLRALEALDEAVVLLKAMQKSFLLSGSVKEVLAEEKKKAKKDRKPSNE